MIEEPRCLRVVRWVALTVLGEAHSLGMTLTRRLMPDARCNTAMLRKLVISLAHSVGAPLLNQYCPYLRLIGLR